MAAPPQTIALAGLMLLNFVLAVAALCLHVLGRRRPRQQVPSPPPPPLEPAVAGEEGGGEERPQNQRRRRRARRKRQQEEEEEGAAAAAAADGGGHGADGDRDAAAKAAGKEALLPRRPQFPLASVAGALQRRINARYDDLARASEAQCLTIEQVNEFVNSLIDARNELLQRYENVERSFKIKKAMLSNHRNYRSSYERLFEQVRRLETERDNLKKDAAIYNYIQERLQKSAAYKMIMELGTMEMEAQEISFEELLAKEKEDTAFWQRNGKMRSFSSK
ncbi:hypothetical protein BDA96_03G033200 [Sorghum bicolor]|uniref:Uncharacterized protein n=2 Tax=Sorghum bicolor TaxID=4558 RepID=A0A921RAN5_SORBI|nr:uncharacterized protein LOC8084337 [Sorghum bicolor]KAG0536073.1 hypothetical protein BDA96_03G033200 [Sorghum bicolor]KXG31611.1 hypothetical protein SORBI_3003G030300 [Sorghum bicolor]|eukprot:XP_021311675.1 uncharacterized protein LOC8084337 [Sorghum bicolor]